MILSVDFNPVLKRTFLLDSIQKNDVNIPNFVTLGPGGEGIELAYFLNSLNEKSISTGFLGGITGTIINDYLESSGVSNQHFLIKDETQESIYISSHDENIIINTRGPRITRDEYEGIMVLYNKLILQSKMICFVGQLPTNIPKEILFDFVLNANMINNKCLIAVKGEDLKYFIDAKPYIVVLEKDQLEELTNLKLDYEYEIIKAGRYIVEKDINLIVISLSNRGSIVLTKDFVYRVDVHLNSSTDNPPNSSYMLGGYALSIERGYDFETFLKVGQACGIVNSFKTKEEIDMSDIKRIMSDIEVSKFNY